MGNSLLPKLPRAGFGIHRPCVERDSVIPQILTERGLLRQAVVSKMSHVPYFMECTAQWGPQVIIK